MTDIEALTDEYEKAVEAYIDDPDNLKTHKAVIDTGERLAAARREQREADIAAGTRAPGISVIADTKGDA